MTVSYQYDVASSSTGGFFRLLWRWRGSIWKLLYKELLLFSGIYLSIAFSYDFLMTDYYKRYYERIVIFCSAFVEIIPLSFILGFYVSFTATRWWQQYTAIPWPDKLMNIIALYVPGNDVTSRVLRRTLMRYLNLTLVLVLRSISIPVKRRFPTKEHLVEAGFMSRPELEMYSSVPSHEFNTFWIPCTWFVNLLREAKSECRITDSGGIKLIMEEFNEFRSKCGLLWSYDWVSIPLVYTQVVTLSTQAFFLASLLGRQHINPPKDQDVKSHVYGEYYIPVFTLLQFILYMGLLKLGEQLINPFGDDDEDFELNWIIDRHLKVSFLGVDILNNDPPPLIKDNYFDEMDIKLPYTEAAVAHKVKTYRGSVAAFHVPTDKHGLVIPEFEDENGEEEDEAATIQSNRDANVFPSSWNLFKERKRKLSSSIDSFNSETMVETGLEETERPSLQPNSSWSSFLISEGAESVKQSKASVWPKEKATEGTQGIRGSTRPETDHSAQAKNVSRPASGKGTRSWQPIPREAKILSPRSDESDLVKQSSFSTSDSSIVIPLGEEPDRRDSSNSTSRFFNFRKSPLQVFSKEYVNAPMSAFKEHAKRNSGDRSSLSSLSLKQQEKPPKTPKSLMKCHRSVDPKLRIRPFRSKVTFSEDTKAGDNSGEIRGVDSATKVAYSSKWDSSSDSVSSMLRHQPEEPISLKRHHTFSESSGSMHIAANRQSPLSDIHLADITKRRQSLDPALYLSNQKTEETLNKDNWLHYQSLPNIQEEDQQTSPTEMAPPDNLHGTNSSPAFSFRPVPSSPPRKTASSEVTTQNVLIPPQSSFDLSTWIGKRRSMKRQKSQDLGDEDIKVQKPPPPPPLRPSIAYLKKQSSDESQTSNMTDNSSSSNQLTKGTSSAMPPGILRRRKEDLKPRQASTESDTGSYHTVNSFLMQVEKSNSSSIDSFTSAVSESIASANSNTNNGATQQSREEITQPSEDSLTNGNRSYHPTFSPIESSLVPTIVFSQSTPSVTSQSSDDQSSPKWDQKYAEFGSSMETVKEGTSYQHRPLYVLPSSPLRRPSREPTSQTGSLGTRPHGGYSTSSSSVSSQSSHHASAPSIPCESLHLTIQDPSECGDDMADTCLSGHSAATTNLHNIDVEVGMPSCNTAIVANNRRAKAQQGNHQHGSLPSNEP